MGFQTPITIDTALKRIQKHDYVLPAIQREFVWSTGQICALFDSLMRGYPIGSFLFWKVHSDHSQDLVTYDFIRDYHELNAPHCPQLDLPSGQVFTAILDGQQRLTALNIGLRGSHAEKLPRKWRNNIDAYPKKRLFLNLVSKAAENELEMEYDFRFLSDEELQTDDEATAHWFPVTKILDLKEGPDVFKYIQQAGLAEHPDAFHTLYRLRDVVWQDPAINYYEEEVQDLDRVLNIFVRVNSAGTVLAYSDILLSIATAQWQELDAREAIYGLVDDLNKMGQGFALSKDLVLKAGLVLTDIGDIRFKVTNFNATNMRRLERNWDSVARALRLAVRLLADFGFSERNLKADSVVIPVAYYLKQKGLDATYQTSAHHEKDRRSLRLWIVRSLLKSGVWGSALDTLLSSVRTVIRESSSNGFPVSAIEAAMTRLGKSLRFEEDEVEDLVESQYGSKNVFPVLTMLYTGINVRSEFHEDHIFAKKWFTPARLRRAGIDEALIGEFRSRFNGLPNLQLLEGSVNTQKADQLPAEWLRSHLPDEQARNMYLAAHDMHDLPDQIDGFLGFYDRRRERMATRLRELLGANKAESRLA
jgi:hypothetical protein